jgi:hypothetical protein
MSGCRAEARHYKRIRLAAGALDGMGMFSASSTRADGAFVDATNENVEPGESASTVGDPESPRKVLVPDDEVCARLLRNE